MPILEPLDVHARIYPSERPPDLERRNELTWRQLSFAHHTQSMGVPSRSMITARNGRCVLRSWREKDANKPRGSSAINPSTSPTSFAIFIVY